MDLTQEEDIKYTPFTRNKRSLGISKTPYNKLIKRFNIKHDSYFNVTNFIKKDEELEDDCLSENMISKRHINTLLIQLPYPVGFPNRYINDPCRELIDKKLKYVKEHNHYVKVHKKKKFRSYDLEERSHLPKYIVNLLDKKVTDPDPYLKTNYDYYYTGGFLDKCYLNNSTYLIRAIEGNILGFLEVENSKTDVCHKLEQPIYNINVHQNGSKLFTMIRHKNKLSLYKTGLEDDTIDIVEAWCVVSEKVPYIDFKLNKYNTGIILGLKANGNLFVCNWEKEKKVNSKLQTDTFQFDFLNQSTIVMISPEETSIYDIRTNDVNLRSKHDKDTLSCDYLTALTLSPQATYAYIISSHNIMKMDLRTLKTVEKYSHLMSHPPLMCKRTRKGNKDLLFLSSGRYNDQILFIDGTCQRVPNIYETYQESCLYHKPILRKNLDQHLQLSTGGICLLPDDEGIKLYTSNSVGDIFCNSVTKEPPDNEMSCLLFSNWVDKMPEVEETLEVTDVKHMTAVKNLLTKSINEKNLERYTSENKELNRFLNLEVVDNNLNLIGIWEEDDDENDEDIIDTSDKVTSWLNSAIHSVNT